MTIKYRQSFVDHVVGDCFRACMATVLQVTPIILPNDHSPHWWFNWKKYLNQFGMELNYDTATGPIWQSHKWIASVPSLNLKEQTHAIVMDGQKVFHDPSTRKRYKTGTNLLGQDIVLGGYFLLVSDATKLHILEEYRKELAESSIK